MTDNRRCRLMLTGFLLALFGVVVFGVILAWPFGAWLFSATGLAFFIWSAVAPSRPSR